MANTTINASPLDALINEAKPDAHANPPTKKLINLLRGWPAPALLPASQLKSAAEYVLSDPAISVPVLQYGIDPGYQPLREEIARWLSGIYQYHPPSDPPSRQPERKGSIKANEITITGGASQALACVLQSFTDPGYTRAVWVAAPCYFMGCAIFEDNGFRRRLRAVPEDEGGVDVTVLEELIRKCDAEKWGHRPSKSPSPHRKLYRHIIYLVATSANPSGKTLSIARRTALIHLAREHDALIISDDVYDLLQWPVTSSPPPTSLVSPSPLPPQTPLPLLSQIDASLPPSRHNPPGKNFSHAISNASFSKLVGPGIRTGWIHGTADFAHGFSVTGTNRSGGAASQFAAAVVWRALSTGEIEEWVDGTVRPALRRRHGIMLREIARELAPLGVKVWGGNGVDGAHQAGGKLGPDELEVYGGYFVWLTLPEEMNAEVVARRARAEEELVVAPGRIFEVAGDEEAARFPQNVRLSFSWVDEEDIVEGVKRLGRVLKRMLGGVEPDMVERNAAEGEAQAFK
ncbi:PLP-dependent transferase [Parathielavia appendiculata]|uniref:PLP-dependent transferase n=1 Tax=Parathielavia appendiculata TaxID=2587402 RepID=A0AAN6U3D0_9PEZI|nr:PLP-dependent transferase [Parathielavia appendiculata]